jgi:hypothetical protein
MRSVDWIDDPWLKECMIAYYLKNFGYYIENGERHVDHPSIREVA